MPVALPAAACSENASRKMAANTSGSRPAFTAITNSPPARYRTTFSGDSFSTARPIDFTPPMITSQVSTAMMTPESQGFIENSAWSATAIELGCVNGVVVSAATPATSA